MNPSSPLLNSADEEFKSFANSAGSLQNKLADLVLKAPSGVECPQRREKPFIFFSMSHEGLDSPKDQPKVQVSEVQNPETEPKKPVFCDLTKLFLLNTALVLTVGLFPLVYNIQDPKKSGLEMLYFPNSDIILRFSYFNVISGIFLIFLLLRFRIDDIESRKKEEQPGILIDGLPEFDERLAEDLAGLIEKRGFSFQEITLIFDCHDLNLVENSNNEVLLDKSTNYKSGVRDTLQERFVNKAFVRFSSQKERARFLQSFGGRKANPLGFRGRKIDVFEAPAVNDVDWMAFERNPCPKGKDIVVFALKSLALLGIFLGICALLLYFQNKNTEFFDVFAAILAVWQFIYLTQGIPISISWIIGKIRFLSKKRRNSFRTYSLYWVCAILTFFLLPALQIAGLKLKYGYFLRNYTIFSMILSSGLFIARFLCFFLNKIPINNEDNVIFSALFVNLAMFLVSAIPIGLVFSLLTILLLLLLEKITSNNHILVIPAKLMDSGLFFQGLGAVLNELLLFSSTSVPNITMTVITALFLLSPIEELTYRIWGSGKSRCLRNEVFSKRYMYFNRFPEELFLVESDEPARFRAGQPSMIWRNRLF